MSAENLREFDLDFHFEDGTSAVKKKRIVKRVLLDRYKGVNLNSIEIGEMGGTTNFVYFDAEERKLPLSVLDLSKKRSRIDALFHLTISDCAMPELQVETVKLGLQNT
jgi:hypothetical protein